MPFSVAQGAKLVVVVFSRGGHHDFLLFESI